jgi:PAS domain S-box-containing protein
MSAFFAIQAHRESVRLSDRQDLVYAVLDSGKYPMAAIDHDNRILLWNDAMERFTGFDQSTIEREGLGVIFPSDAAFQHHKERMKEGLDQSKPLPLPIITHGQLKTADGRILPVILSIYVYDSVSDGRFAVARVCQEKSMVVDLDDGGKDAN